MSEERRRATVETDHGDPETARRVANAVSPDNTGAMTTAVDGRVVRTEITREQTGGLGTTLDDYVVNLGVAAQLATKDGASSTQTNDT